MSKIMIITGEVSGDLQAARVVEALQKRSTKLSFLGMGGQALRALGVKIIYDPTQVSTIGFIEALKKLPHFYKLLDMMTEVITLERPDLLFLVDYSGFNQRMAKIGQRMGVPVVNYFSPSAWVWGRWRAKRMAKYGAKIAAVFPMEAEVYRKAGADVTFVGHPLLDFVFPKTSKEEFFRSLNLGQDRRLIGLMPGSRRGEIVSLLPPMLEAAEIIYQQIPEVSFVLPIAAPALKDLLFSLYQESIAELPLQFIDGQAYELMNAAELIICASGTVTLEAACLKTPMIISYKTSWSTYHLGKLLANINFAGLPNIISGREIVPELLQEQVTGVTLAKAALRILEDPSERQRIIKDLQQVRQALGASGAVERVADLIVQVLDQ